MSRVLILGCGPAGLAAAAAVVSSGHEAVIMAKAPIPSQLYGCQYLHAPVPGYTTVRRTRVRYELIGTTDQYREKVYGRKWFGKVSPEDFVGEHDAWDIRETYAHMWRDLIETKRATLIQVDIRLGNIPLVSDLRPKEIISTIPAKALCSKNHGFTAHGIWANGSMGAEVASPDSIICDGTDAVPWYRISNVFGYRTMEWAERPQHQAVPVLKPLSNDCDCHPNIIRVGRYGAWEKKWLVHQVYPAVMEILK